MGAELMPDRRSTNAAFPRNVRPAASRRNEPIRTTESGPSAATSRSMASTVRSAMMRMRTPGGTGVSRAVASQARARSPAPEMNTISRVRGRSARAIPMVGPASIWTGAPMKSGGRFMAASVGA
jgi:hypothetical protein